VQIAVLTAVKSWARIDCYGKIPGRLEHKLYSETL